MNSFPRFAPALLALLAACGTPQEQCISRETRDLRTLDRLIAETEGNIARGFAYEERTTYRTTWVDCTPQPQLPPHGGEVPPVKPRMCLDEVPETVRAPVAIDLQAEAQKLASMKARRAEMSRAADDRIRACRAAYPE